MNILLVSENLFDKNKPTAIMNRFLTHSMQDNIDALCISTSSDRFNDAIRRFKEIHGGKYPIIYGDNINIEVYNHKYPLNSEGLVTDEGQIYAMDDAVCEIEFYKDANPKYAYIPLDIFLNQIPTLPTVEQSAAILAKPIDGDGLLNGKPIAVPLQKFLDLIEDSVDEETKEKIRKAKEEFNSKTKS